MFFVVEKIVRQVEKSSSKGGLPWGHHHHHHHHLQEDHNEEHVGDGKAQGQDIVPEKRTLQDKPSGCTQEKMNAQEPRQRKVSRISLN